MKRNEVIKHVGYTVPHTLGDYSDVRCAAYDAREYGIKSMEVFPNTLEMVLEILGPTDVDVCVKCSWPMTLTTELAVSEIKQMDKLGAKSFIMPFAYNHFFSGDYDYVLKDLKACREAAGDKLLKICLHGEFMKTEQLKKICELCKEAGIQGVVTSLTGGKIWDAEAEKVVPVTTTPEEVALIRSILPDAYIEVQDGITDAEKIEKLVDAGANACVCAAAFDIIKKTAE